MIKALLKYLLSLSILLLSGYSQLTAHPYKESTFHSPIRNLNEAEHATCGIEQYDHSFIIKSSSPDEEKKNYKIDVAENEVEEEDEIVFSRKHFQSGNYAASIFFAQTFKRFFNGKKILPFYKYFSRTLSCRYLIFEAFRI